MVKTIRSCSLSLKSRRSEERTMSQILPRERQKKPATTRIYVGNSFNNNSAIPEQQCKNIIQDSYVGLQNFQFQNFD